MRPPVTARALEAAGLTLAADIAAARTLAALCPHIGRLREKGACVWHEYKAHWSLFPRNDGGMLEVGLADGRAAERTQAVLASALQAVLRARVSPDRPIQGTLKVFLAGSYLGLDIDVFATGWVPSGPRQQMDLTAKVQRTVTCHERTLQAAASACGDDIVVAGHLVRRSGGGVRFVPWRVTTAKEEGVVPRDRARALEAVAEEALRDLSRRPDGIPWFGVTTMPQVALTFARPRGPCRRASGAPAWRVSLAWQALSPAHDARWTISTVLDFVPGRILSEPDAPMRAAIAAQLTQLGPAFGEEVRAAWADAHEAADRVPLWAAIHDEPGAWAGAWLQAVGAWRSGPLGRSLVRLRLSADGPVRVGRDAHARCLFDVTVPAAAVGRVLAARVPTGVVFPHERHIHGSVVDLRPVCDMQDVWRIVAVRWPDADIAAAGLETVAAYAVSAPGQKMLEAVPTLDAARERLRRQAAALL